MLFRSYQNAEVLGGHAGNVPGLGGERFRVADTSIRARSDAARQWEGWGTALKPAHEPICVARKPLVKGNTVAANVMEFGTGALNIDGCRIAGESTRRSNTAEIGYHGGNLAESYDTGSDAGRWPANLILSYNEDEYELKPSVTPEQRKQLLKWMYENS